MGSIQSQEKEKRKGKNRQEKRKGEERPSIFTVAEPQKIIYY